MAKNALKHGIKLVQNEDVEEPGKEPGVNELSMLVASEIEAAGLKSVEFTSKAPGMAHSSNSVGMIEMLDLIVETGACARNDGWDTVHWTVDPRVTVFAPGAASTGPDTSGKHHSRIVLLLYRGDDYFTCTELGEGGWHLLFVLAAFPSAVCLHLCPSCVGL